MRHGVEHEGRPGKGDRQSKGEQRRHRVARTTQEQQSGKAQCQDAARELDDHLRQAPHFESQTHPAIRLVERAAIDVGDGVMDVPVGGLEGQADRSALRFAQQGCEVLVLGRDRLAVDRQQHVVVANPRRAAGGTEWPNQPPLNVLADGNQPGFVIGPPDACAFETGARKEIKHGGQRQRHRRQPRHAIGGEPAVVECR